MSASRLAKTTSLRPLRNKRPGRQQGGETVEFAFTLLWIIVLFFFGIEVLLMIFNYGTLKNANAIAARDASLYWEDSTSYLQPDDSDYFTNRDFIRINKANALRRGLRLADAMVRPGVRPLALNDAEIIIQRSSGDIEIRNSATAEAGDYLRVSFNNNSPGLLILNKIFPGIFDTSSGSNNPLIVSAELPHEYE